MKYLFKALTFFRRLTFSYIRYGGASYIFVNEYSASHETNYLETLSAREPQRKIVTKSQNQRSLPRANESCHKYINICIYNYIYNLYIYTDFIYIMPLLLPAMWFIRSHRLNLLVSQYLFSRPLKTPFFVSIAIRCRQSPYVSSIKW